MLEQTMEDQYGHYLGADAESAMSAFVAFAADLVGEIVQAAATASLSGAAQSHRTLAADLLATDQEVASGGCVCRGVDTSRLRGPPAT